MESTQQRSAHSTKILPRILTKLRERNVRTATTYADSSSNTVIRDTCLNWKVTLPDLQRTTRPSSKPNKLWKMNSSMNYYRWIQINLQHSKSASAALAQTLLDLDIDIALVQEPYGVLDEKIKLPDIPNNYTVYHSLNNHWACGAAIVVKRKI